MALTILKQSVLFTEKSLFLHKKRNCISFDVDCRTNKREIIKAAQLALRVEVYRVNTSLMKCKSGSGVFGKIKKKKKAFVFIRDGQAVDLSLLS